MVFQILKSPILSGVGYFGRSYEEIMQTDAFAMESYQSFTCRQCSIYLLAADSFMTHNGACFKGINVVQIQMHSH